MKISFVIPAFNEESTLAACLQSIQAQTIFSPIETEIIVVNNASTDRTGEVAASFPNVKIIFEPRKGLTFARQAGFEASKGSLIANIDADSLLTTGWIEQVAEKFSDNAHLIAISGPVIYYDLNIFLNILVRIYYYFGFATYLLNRFVLNAGSLMQGSNSVVRRTALEKISGYNTDITFYGEDTDLANRLSQIGPVQFSFEAPIYTSGRRFKSEGMIITGFRYCANYFSTIIWEKPISKKYTDVRANIQVQIKTDVKKLRTALTAMEILLVTILFAVYSLTITHSALAKNIIRETRLHVTQFSINHFDPDGK